MWQNTKKKKKNLTRAPVKELSKCAEKLINIQV